MSPVGRGAEQQLTAADAGSGHGAQVVANPGAGRPRGGRRDWVQVVGDVGPPACALVVGMVARWDMLMRYDIRRVPCLAFSYDAPRV